MKSIEITEDQKIKLLEMCTYLFPEYGEPEGGITFHHHDDLKRKPIAEYKNYLPGFLFGFKSNGEDGDSYDHASLFIHWFEFCMTHLPEKIFGKRKNSFEGINGRPYWCEKVAESFAKVHPVDYLYQEFKKLNITK